MGSGPVVDVMVRRRWGVPHSGDVGDGWYFNVDDRVEDGVVNFYHSGGGSIRGAVSHNGVPRMWSGGPHTMHGVGQAQGHRVSHAGGVGDEHQRLVGIARGAVEIRGEVPHVPVVPVELARRVDPGDQPYG